MKAARLLMLTVFLALLFSWAPAGAAERFPRPQFETGHELPLTTVPSGRAEYLQYIDVAVLVAALSLSAYLALRRRSRLAVAGLTLLSLAYFGFYRKGCVCAVGSIQNVALALFDSTYLVPLFVAAFFLLPLVFALLVGRVFCGAVCPLGAIQDVFLIRPLKLPRWLEQALGTFPYIYLALAVVFVAGGAPFLICRYDPFVSFFRLSGSMTILTLGGALLLAGTVVGRPYCRFLCPYSVLLRWLSRFSFFHATITPDECVKCRLCENACPFGAILTPTPEESGETRQRGVRRLALLLALLPILIAGGGAAGWLVGGPLSRSQKTVLRADLVSAEEGGEERGLTFESEAFLSTGEPTVQLYREALAVHGRFRKAAAVAGALLGLALSVKLLGLSIRRKREDYEMDKARCLSCGRCFQYCPREHLRRADAGESSQ